MGGYMPPRIPGRLAPRPGDAQFNLQQSVTAGADELERQRKGATAIPPRGGAQIVAGSRANMSAPTPAPAGGALPDKDAQKAALDAAARAAAAKARDGGTPAEKTGQGAAAPGRGTGGAQSPGQNGAVGQNGAGEARPVDPNTGYYQQTFAVTGPDGTIRFMDDLGAARAQGGKAGDYAGGIAQVRARGGEERFQPHQIDSDAQGAPVYAPTPEYQPVDAAYGSDGSAAFTQAGPMSERTSGAMSRALDASAGTGVPFSQKLRGQMGSLLAGAGGDLRDRINYREYLERRIAEEEAKEAAELGHKVTMAKGEYELEAAQMDPMALARLNAESRYGGDYIKAAQAQATTDQALATMAQLQQLMSQAKTPEDRQRIEMLIRGYMAAVGRPVPGSFPDPNGFPFGVPAPIAGGPAPGGTQ
jgi:hypothetical protein